MITNPQIKLNIWEKINQKGLTMILYEGQIPFASSETTLKEWRVFFTFEALNPLIPPYPSGTQLFRARHSDKYPYQLLIIEPVKDIFKSVKMEGTYFVAYTAPFDGKTKLPFNDVYIYVDKGIRLRE